MSDGLGLRDQKKLETWRAIHDAAVTLFLERGYENVSISDIAKAARVAPSTFFNYFTTKESVVFDPDPADLPTVRRLLAARPSGEDLWTSLREVLLGYLAVMDSRLVTQKKLKASSSVLADCGRELGDRVREVLVEWAAERHPELPALRALLLINLSMAAVLTSFALWDPGTGLGEFFAMARDCLDQAAAGIAQAGTGRERDLAGERP